MTNDDERKNGAQAEGDIRNAGTFFGFRADRHTLRGRIGKETGQAIERTYVRDGNREDLVDIELSEIAVLETYLPEQLSAAELDTLIDQAIADSGATSIRDMGKVMGQVKVTTHVEGSKGSKPSDEIGSGGLPCFGQPCA